MDATLDISVVVPLYNEEESLPELVEWIDRVARGEGFVLRGNPGGRRFRRWFVARDRKSARAGFGGAGDQVRSQLRVNPPPCIAVSPKRAARWFSRWTPTCRTRRTRFRLCGVWSSTKGTTWCRAGKKKRHDPAGKRWPSKFFNWTARTVSGIRLHDFNCGLKAYRRRVVKAIEVYGEMHRYIPILAKQAGFKRIGEKVVEHRARKYGHSKFGMERMVKGYLDLITVSFLSRFGRSPMYFFGSLGTLMFLFGGCTTAWVIGAKLYKQCHDLPVRAVTDQPLFYLSLLAVVLGVQLFLAGFLGELIDRNAADRNKYLIEKTLDNQ